MMRRWLVSMIIAAAVAGTAPGPTTAAAQDSAEATYLRYQRAVRAGERCRRDHPFGSAQHSRMAGYIDAKINYTIAAGRRLQLIEEAKHEVDRLVDGNGCRGDVADILAVYDAELAPLLTQ